MNFCVYILQSIKTGKFYVGSTQDIKDRLVRHNQGRSKATKAGIPWKLIKTISCTNLSEARILEKKVKNLGAKRFLKSQQ